MDIPPVRSAWPLLLCASLIHIPLKQVCFAPKSHWISQQRSSSIFSLASSLVSHTSCHGSFLWIPPPPPFFFFFYQRELPSDIRSRADAASANTYPGFLSSTQETTLPSFIVVIWPMGWEVTKCQDVCVRSLCSLFPYLLQ